MKPWQVLSELLGELYRGSLPANRATRHLLWCDISDTVHFLVNHPDAVAETLGGADVT